jgi:hypothetical protein
MIPRRVVGVENMGSDVVYVRSPGASASRTLAVTVPGTGLAVRGTLCHNTGSIVPRVGCGAGDYVMDASWLWNPSTIKRVDWVR